MTTASRTRRRWNPLGLALFTWGFLLWRADAGSPVDPKVEEIDTDLATEEADEGSPLLHVPAEAAGTQGASDIYSVIVISDHQQRSNAFRDSARVNAYSEEVVLVQFGDVPNPDVALALDSPPFNVSHTPRASKRVRIYHTGNERLPEAPAITHLKASCEDPSEITLIVLTDEFCTEKPLTQTFPPACWANIARHYPFSPESPDKEPRHAYIPLGPRNNFNFVDASERVPASERGTFYGVAVTEDTAPRRIKLVNITSGFRAEHPSIPAFVNDKHLNSGDYQSLLLDSSFTVCPGGHNPETFRMFEALEAGSIPIISRRDFLYPSYQAPFPCGKGDASWNTVAASPFAQAVSVGSWDELPDLLERLTSSPAEYIDQLQAESVAWYEALMRRMYRTLLHFGQGYELWPQYGPLILEGFTAPTEPYPETLPYDPDEL